MNIFKRKEVKPIETLEEENKRLKKVIKKSVKAINFVLLMFVIATILRNFLEWPIVGISIDISILGFYVMSGYVKKKMQRKEEKEKEKNEKNE